MIDYYKNKYDIRIEEKEGHKPILLVDNKMERKKKAGSSTGNTYLLP